MVHTDDKGNVLVSVRGPHQGPKQATKASGAFVGQDDNGWSSNSWVGEDTDTRAQDNVMSRYGLGNADAYPCVSGF